VLRQPFVDKLVDGTAEILRVGIDVVLLRPAPPWTTLPAPRPLGPMPALHAMGLECLRINHRLAGDLALPAEFVAAEQRHGHRPLGRGVGAATVPRGGWPCGW